MPKNLENQQIAKEIKISHFRDPTSGIRPLSLDQSGTIIVEGTVPCTMHCRPSSGTAAPSDLLPSPLGVNRGEKLPQNPIPDLEPRAKLHALKPNATSDPFVSVTNKNNIRVWDRRLLASLISRHNSIGKASTAEQGLPAREHHRSQFGHDTSRDDKVQKTGEGVRAEDKGRAGTLTNTS
jgi:hypothetical protein